MSSLHDPSAYRLDTLLVGTDFSEAAENAVERACELALAHDARLIIVHSMTLQIPPAGGPKLMNLPVDFEARVREASLGALEALVEKARERDIEVESELIAGAPVAGLVGIAEQRGADLIVTATRGVTGLAHLILGSTAEQLVQKARCPVLSVHPEDTRSLAAVRRVLVPTDYSTDAEVAAHTVAELLGHRAEEIEISLAHAYHLPAGVSQLLGYYPIGVEIADSAAEQAREALEPIASKLRDKGFTVESLALQGYPSDVLLRLVEARDIEMIAMGTRGLSGLRGALVGSTARALVQHAKCPVLTVSRRDA